MTLKDLLDDITFYFKDKNIPLDKIEVRYFVWDQKRAVELDCIGGCFNGERKIYLTFMVSRKNDITRN